MNDLLDSPEQTRKSRKSAFLGALALIIVGVYAAGVLFSITRIHTILFSGPIIACCGAVALISGLLLREKIMTALGGAVLLSTLGLFLLINSFRISPQQARTIVPALSGICLFVLIGLVIWLFISFKRK